MKKFLSVLFMLAVVVSVGCDSDNTASIPSVHSSSEQPATPPALENQGGGAGPVEPPSLDL